MMLRAIEADEGIVIKDSIMSECEKLQEVYSTGSYLEKWVGEACEDDYINIRLAEGDIPPVSWARKENYALKSVYRGSEIIGILEVYHGYPQENVLWVGYLFLSPEHQGKGYGQKIIGALRDEARNCGFEKIGIGVHLKNWPALRFWTKAGFDRVIKVTGDKVHSENTFAVIALEKNL